MSGHFGAGGSSAGARAVRPLASPPQLPCGHAVKRAAPRGSGRSRRRAPSRGGGRRRGDTGFPHREGAACGEAIAGARPVEVKSPSERRCGGFGEAGGTSGETCAGGEAGRPLRGSLVSRQGKAGGRLGWTCCRRSAWPQGKRGPGGSGRSVPVWGSWPCCRGVVELSGAAV